MEEERFKFGFAVSKLSRFFVVTTDVFARFSRGAVFEWAERIKDEHYKLPWREHQFLIGRCDPW